MSLVEQFQQLFGVRVKGRRRALHLTQFELSKQLHISRTTLANIEAGTQRTSVFLLANLAQTLEVSTEDLVPKIADAEVRFRQSQQVFLEAAEKPTLLSQALEELNIPTESESTLQKVLEQVRIQYGELEPAKKEESDGD